MAEGFGDVKAVWKHKVGIIKSSLHFNFQSAGCFFHLVETPLSGCIK